MKKWAIYTTFFSKLYDEHYNCDLSFNRENFIFVKVNNDYQLDIKNCSINYNIKYENSFPIYSEDWQKKGYHENSVLYHVYKNLEFRKYDYVGFLEYDHVLQHDFTKKIQKFLDNSNEDVIFSFNKFSFSQLWDQGILLNPYRKKKQEGRSDSKWNCINVILKEFNEYYKTKFTLDDLKQTNCFPICHAILLPSHLFENIMRFHAEVMESARIEKFHSFNWRSNAGIMERYLSVSLALQQKRFIDSIQLEHRHCDIKVIKPEWTERTFIKKIRFNLFGY